MAEILRVGTSAGGARPKALIALDPETEEVRSGQLPLGVLAIDRDRPRQPDRHLRDPEEVLDVAWEHAGVESSEEATMDEREEVETREGAGAVPRDRDDDYTRDGAGPLLGKGASGPLGRGSYAEGSRHRLASCLLPSPPTANSESTNTPTPPLVRVSAWFG